MEMEHAGVAAQGQRSGRGGAFQDHIKINFFKGAALDDPKGLFNAGLDAKASRAIDLHEGDKVNEAALKALVRAAAAPNGC